MEQLLKDCLTAKDGESYDVGRVLLLIGGLAFIVMAAYACFHGGQFDADKFGSGLGWILGGGGVGLGAKARTEPDQ